MSSAVVSGRKYCEELAPSKPLETIHHTLVSPQDELHLIVIKELLHSVWPKLDNVSCPIGVSDEVWLDSQFLVIVSRVTPQYVYHQLLFWCGNLMDNFQGSLDHFNLVQTD